MGTLGTVSIVREAKVILKVSVTHDGYNAKRFSDELQRLISRLEPDLRFKVITLNDIHKLAGKCEFGSRDCLVVMNETEYVFHGDVDLPEETYRRTFNDPMIHPVYRIVAENTVVINL
ncbi:hypothetical protein A2533_01885 [Candidatus Falkowbacteria bacterium RIFOXYD2_FULL_35_9]|uniref:Uncharacterized protein n=1 Tax=Candidatus Falkowbacteria bacterium RIFOXYC2_FULL_36_12 TaxID=1798002 RepID=A0A1F5SZ76_9BACT|nr:MAG: hypothetical protein A2300_01635 [Candidatus Falkowbacteria bacterium RIFOXYB2_FULL_35_7]OGF31796.1 MAG: hypothetical protein A2478_04915 [Candidatus Falkowbacteria bacterium RIFOXYC2_FULL_36_12]OGF33794.1 MAG: hypothetical protein A2223_00275 [Candidatus Falkowbacteria bacterium RIFOXYA2_FULL_35_8]OGF48254.1 MAG: hypothetical protein A2533_01885 [Candidatus Falkowbacteria bacterium RIFOXYD2_FULL_35_9]